MCQDGLPSYITDTHRAKNLTGVGISSKKIAEVALKVGTLLSVIIQMAHSLISAAFICINVLASQRNGMSVPRARNESVVATAIMKVLILGVRSKGKPSSLERHHISPQLHM